MLVPLVLVLVAVVSRPSPAIIHRAQKLGLVGKNSLMPDIRVIHSVICNDFFTPCRSG